MTKLALQRVSEFANRLRAYKVEIDGREVSRVRNGKRVEIEVAPGHHAMRLTIDWCSSNTVDFDAADEVLQFECGSNFKGLGLFRGVGNVMAGGDDYLWLRNTTEPESV